MATEDATNPAADVDTSTAGVADQGNSAQTDDIDTSDIDRVEVPDDEGETPPADGDGDGPASVKTAAADDEEEVELADGRKVKAPKELALGYLRQADYTQKTQDLAAQRRTLETEQQSWESQREQSRAALPEEHATLAVLKHNVASYEAQLQQPDSNGVKLADIDWISFLAQTRANPDMKPVYDEYRTRYEAVRQSIDVLKENLTAAEQDLKTKDGQRLQAQREQAEQALAKAREETGKVLAREIKGWSAKEAEETARFAIESGVQPDEIMQMTDHRVWKMLHTTKTLTAENAQLKAALKQHQTAKNNQTAQEVKPATPAKGAAQPNRVRDDVSTDEWMRRRNAQDAKKRA